MISCTQPTSQQTSHPANLRTARVDDIAKKEDNDDIDQLVHEKDGYNGDDERKDEDGDDHLNKNNHENDGDVVGDDISDELLATKGLPIRLMMILIPPVWWTTTDGIFNQKKQSINSSATRKPFLANCSPQKNPKNQQDRSFRADS